MLIVKISSLGDVIHAFAFVNRLKAEKPDTVIDWVVSDIYTELVEAVEGVRNVIPFRRNDWKHNWWKPKTFREVASFIKTIRSEKYDICLDLQGLFRSGLITYLSGASLTAGFADGREGSRIFYQKKIGTKGARGVHAVDKLLGALDVAGVSTQTDRPDFGFTIPDSFGESAGAILRETGIKGEYLVFHTGARWKTKLWPDRYWRALAETVYSNHSIPIAFTGTSEDSEPVAEITSGLSYAKNLCGKGNLLELASILRGAKFMVTVDSGPMHMAAALGVPMAAIFGPTSPKKTGPVSAGKIKIFSENIECVPCFKRRCGRNHECMTGIEPGAVAAGIAGMIRNV
jgi:lipopolysaccharide heptosyltransferase I